MEFVSGGELFTHLREEGMFEPHKAAYFLFNTASTHRTWFSSLSTSTPKTSYTGTSNQKIFWLELMDISNWPILDLPSKLKIEPLPSVELLNTSPLRSCKIKATESQLIGGLWECWSTKWLQALTPLPMTTLFWSTKTSWKESCISQKDSITMPNLLWNTSWSTISAKDTATSRTV